jgi:hypothetical protein
MKTISEDSFIDMLPERFLTYTPKGKDSKTEKVKTIYCNQVAKMPNKRNFTRLIKELNILHVKYCKTNYKREIR